MQAINREYKSHIGSCAETTQNPTEVVRLQIGVKLRDVTTDKWYRWKRKTTFKKMSVRMSSGNYILIR